MSGEVLEPTAAAVVTGPVEVPVVQGRAVELDGAVALPDLRNPYLVYLNSLTNPETRRAMAGCLDRLVVLQAVKQGSSEADVAALGSAFGRFFPWWELRYEHTAALQATLAAKMETTKNPGGWAPAYVNKHLTALRGVLKTCWRLRLIDPDEYVRAIDLEPVRGTRVPAGRNVSATEFDATLDAAEADARRPAAARRRPAGVRDAAILAILRTTGMRRAELAAASCADYHPDDYEIRIIGKGGRERLVPLDPDTVAFVEAWLTLTGHNSGALFFALVHLDELQEAIAKGQEIPAPHLSAAAIGAVVKTREAKAKYPRPRRHTTPTVHDYRRSLVGDLLDAGVDPVIVGQITGQTPATVAKYDRRPGSTRHQAVAGLLGRTPQPAAAPEVPTDEPVPANPPAAQVQLALPPAERSAGRAEAARAAGTVHRLKVRLADVRPQVWRRLEVPSTTPLADLAAIINTAFGWSGEHLHEFDGGRNENVSLGMVLAAPGWNAHYVYDLGDYWTLDITVEAIHSARPGSAHPRCTGGARNGPIEDCGGPEGYTHALAAIRARKGWLYTELRERGEHRHDPAAFDAAEITQQLRELTTARTAPPVSEPPAMHRVAQSTPPEPTDPGTLPAPARAAAQPPVQDGPIMKATLDAGGQDRPRVAELYVARLHGEDYLLLADGVRAGWLRGTGPGYETHAPDGQIVGSTEDRSLFTAARLAADAFGYSGGPAAHVSSGDLDEGRGHRLETGPAALASWTLLRGRIASREDVIVRGRCVGWVQRHPAGGFLACTLAGPIPLPRTGLACGAPTREAAVLALFTAMWAPVPLPDLGPEATAVRQAKARPKNERPLSPYTDHELAAAALPHNLIRPPGGGYQVAIDENILGTVYRTGRHWQALDPPGRTMIHRAATRTEAIDRLLATPGPLFGDPADIALHHLDS